ncbi:conjugal transfer protein TraN, partial [Streptosporangium carneum]
MCEDLVDGAGPPDDTVTEVGEGEWQEADCPDVSDEDLDCEPQETVCTEGAGSRLIGGQEVFEECWARETAYICEGVGEILTDCDPPDYCEFSHETCLDEVP